VKHISKTRLEQALENLKAIRAQLPAQGVQHLLPFLALRQKGVGPGESKRYEEQDDFAFWDRYMLVDDSSEQGRYYDPFAGVRRIGTHPHSNVATARKHTFARSWQAAEYEVVDGQTVWRLADDYLAIVVQRCLTKAGHTTRVPALDLVLWLLRHTDFEDGFSVAALIGRFKGEFGLTDAELEALFEVTDENSEGVFTASALAREEVLSLLPVIPAQPTLATAFREAATVFAPAAGDVSRNLALPDGVVEQATTALSLGSHLILAGPPGTGKSTLAERLAAAASESDYASSYVTATATSDWTTFDTIGGYMPTGNGNELVFREGVVLRAISEDSWCIVDELNRANIDRAIGSLITLLAGSDDTAVVELPHLHLVGSEGEARYEPVRIRRDNGVARSGRDPDSGDYVIGRNWRLIATMNTLDRNNLFPLTAAFARRFATVYVGIPDSESVFSALGVTSEAVKDVFRVLMTEVDSEWVNPRPLGPSFTRDAWAYVSKRIEAEVAPHEAMLEALPLYVLPQFTGMETDEWTTLRDRLVEALARSADIATQESVRTRSQTVLNSAMRGLFGDW
jgi:DNA polymerase III delta prime subunit